MSATERDYQLDLALHCLCRIGDATASELLEAMGSAALDAGHPRQLLPVTPAAVAGLLRDLDRRGEVARKENRPSSRDGRAVAVWGLSTERECGTLPMPPRAGQAGMSTVVAIAPLGTPDRTRGLTPELRMGLLEMEFQALLEQMDRDHQASQARARREFEAFRVRVGKVLAFTAAQPA
jgi:hypothetical protein